MNLLNDCVLLQLGSLIDERSVLFGCFPACFIPTERTAHLPSVRLRPVLLSPAFTIRTHRVCKAALASSLFFSCFAIASLPPLIQAVILQSITVNRGRTDAKMLLLFGSLLIPLLLLRYGQVKCCSSSIYAQSQPRTVKWTSAPTDPFGWWGNEQASLVPFLFSPPTIVERWTRTDFSLLHASLSVPCSVLALDDFDNRQFNSFTPSVFLLPEEWINLLPILTHAVYQSGRADVSNLCDLFDENQSDFVPGCQNWSRIAAWKRLRIFYDLPSPLGPYRSLTDHHHHKMDQQCINGTWTLNASSMIRQWMAHRPPWTRFNATLPIIVMTDHRSWPSNGLSAHQAELELTYWMDSKNLCVCATRTQ